MRLARTIVLLGCAVALTFYACRFIDAQRGVATREAQKTRDLIQSEIDSTRASLLQTVNSQATGIRGDVMKRMDDLIDITRPVPTQVLETVNMAVADANDRLKVLDNLKPSLKNLDDITSMAKSDLADSRRAVEAAIHPEDIAGAVRDTRFLLARGARTAGAVEGAAADFRKSVPDLIDGLQHVVENSDRTTQATTATMQASAAVMSNFKTATTPLPKALRVGLQVGGPLAMAAYYMSLMLVSLGII